MKARYGEPFVRISITITGPEHIFPWGKTHRSHERFRGRKWDPSWRCRMSVACTTATNDRLPEKARIQPPYALPLLGPLQSASEICSVAQACIMQISFTRLNEGCKPLETLRFVWRLVSCTEFTAQPRPSSLRDRRQRMTCKCRR